MQLPKIKEWTSAFMAKKPKTTAPSGAVRLVAALLWTAALSSFVVLVFLFVLPSPHKHVDTPRTCGPYLTTPGFTVPHWDIAILEGSPLEVYCVLNKDHELGRDHNATDLRFYQNGTAVAPQFLTVVNETTLRYYVEKPTPMKAMLFCNLKPREKDREIFVCLNMITVRPDHRVYDILRIIAGVLVLGCVACLGIWFARRFYKACRAGKELAKNQATMLSANETKDSGFPKITWIHQDSAESNTQADIQERLLQTRDEEIAAA